MYKQMNFRGCGKNNITTPEDKLVCGPTLGGSKYCDFEMLQAPSYKELNLYLVGCSSIFFHPAKRGKSAWTITPQSESDLDWGTLNIGGK